MVVTVAQRDARRLEEVHTAVEILKAKLSSYAVADGGSFIVFGSAARNDLHPDSDFDLVIDFPVDVERAARGYAETLSWQSGLEPDLYLLSEVSPALMIRVKRDGVILA